MKLRAGRHFPDSAVLLRGETRENEDAAKFAVACCIGGAEVETKKNNQPRECEQAEESLKERRTSPPPPLQMLPRALANSVSGAGE